MMKLPIFLLTLSCWNWDVTRIEPLTYSFTPKIDSIKIKKSLISRDNYYENQEKFDIQWHNSFKYRLR